MDKAGGIMTDVVDEIRRVTDLMGEISAASNEQSEGVMQVGQSIIEMDKGTQQNAALVEEMAAATGLSGQANDLVHAVEVFKISAVTNKPLPKNRVHTPAPLNLNSNNAAMNKKVPTKMRTSNIVQAD